MKDLQDLAAHIFARGKTDAESTNAEVDSKKKQQNKDPHSNSNLSPLARFLLSRFVKKLYSFKTKAMIHECATNCSSMIMMNWN